MAIAADRFDGPDCGHEAPFRPRTAGPPAAGARTRAERPLETGGTTRLRLGDRHLEDAPEAPAASDDGIQHVGRVRGHHGRAQGLGPVSYTHLRAHETGRNL